MTESFTQILQNTLAEDASEKELFFELKNRKLSFYQVNDWNFRMKIPYRLTLYLVEERLLIYEISGRLDATALHRAEALLEQIETIFADKIEAIVFNFLKVSNIAILARNELRTISLNISKRWKKFYIIFSKKLKPLFEAISIHENASLANVLRMNTLEEVLLHFFFNETPTKLITNNKTKESRPLPSLSRVQLERLAKDLLMENARLKAIQQVQLYRLYQIIYHISWEGGEFIERGADKYKARAAAKLPNNASADDLQSAIALLKSDIQEKLLELKRLNQSLAELAEQSDEKREENEANLLSLIENTSDFIYSIDEDFNYIVANSAYKDFMKRYKKVHVRQGRNALEGLDEKEKQFWSYHYRETFFGKITKATQEIIFQDKVFYYEASFHPIYVHKEITGITVFLKDITQEKLAERKLKEQNEELKKVNSELDQFVYRTSHDLRAPLTSILGLVNIARIDESSSATRSYLDMIEKSIKKLDKFIGDIIDYSRNTRLEIQIEKIDFQKEIQAIIEELAYIPHSSLIRKEIIVEEEVPFFSDKLRLHVILKNLLSNAFKYHRLEPEQPFVKVHVIVKALEVYISVADNGQGIAEGFLPKIFDMFFRASEKETGSGLGLYIVREAVKKLEGSISVTSKLGVGTTFEIRLPNLYVLNA